MDEFNNILKLFCTIEYKNIMFASLQLLSKYLLIFYLKKMLEIFTFSKSCI